MDPVQKLQLQPKPNNEDVDLGQLFYKTGGLIRSFFTKTRQLLNRIIQMLFWVFIFFKKKIIWLILGAVAGMSFGFYSLNKKETKYHSTITVRTNFTSSRSFYNMIDFFNNLINTSQTNRLMSIFNLSDNEASSLVLFEVVPVESEFVFADLYRDQFLNNEKDSRNKMDTFWTRAVPYNTFKTSISKFDYPLHYLKVISTKPDIFPKLEKGIIDKMSSDKFLQSIKAINISINREKIETLTNSIKTLDTLIETYNKNPLDSYRKGQDNNSIILLNGNANTRIPEIELFNKQMELRKELTAARKKEIIESEIIQVYSHFNEIGNKENTGNQEISKYALLGLLLSIAILSIIQFLRYLTILEKKLAKPILN